MDSAAVATKKKKKNNKKKKGKPGANAANDLNRKSIFETMAVSKLAESKEDESKLANDTLAKKVNGNSAFLFKIGQIASVRLSLLLVPLQVTAQMSVAKLSR